MEGAVVLIGSGRRRHGNALEIFVLRFLPAQLQAVTILGDIEVIPAIFRCEPDFPLRPLMTKRDSEER